MQKHKFLSFMVLRALSVAVGVHVFFIGGETAFRGVISCFSDYTWLTLLVGVPVFVAIFTVGALILVRIEDDEAGRNRAGRLEKVVVLYLAAFELFCIAILFWPWTSGQFVLSRQLEVFGLLFALAGLAAAYVVYYCNATDGWKKNMPEKEQAVLDEHKRKTDELIADFQREREIKQSHEAMARIAARIKARQDNTDRLKEKNSGRPQPHGRDPPRVYHDTKNDCRAAMSGIVPTMRPVGFYYSLASCPVSGWSFSTIAHRLGENLSPRQI